MSWDQLADILRLAREEARENAQAPPEACPHDGEPLREGPDGELFCPSDGWRPGARRVGDDIAR